MAFLDRVTAELSLGGEGELGEVAVADDPAELAFGFEHAGGRPAQKTKAVRSLLSSPKFHQDLTTAGYPQG